MNRVRAEQALEIFVDVLASNENATWAQFENKCGHDAELQTAVRSLYDADRALSDAAQKTVDERAMHLRTSLANELISQASVETDVDQSGQLIDGYELIERIGSGGMGEIYRARNSAAGFEHDVALKLMRQVSLTDETRRLFESERSLLAKLKHPNIAALYAGGTTDEGVPYFVLELVKGKSIDQFCDDNDATIQGRLEVFQTVCAAVQFAHSQLIIHRDIKPGNVLVDKNRLVKLLDFGIAKQLTGSNNDQTVAFQAAFTPNYASPEQLLGTPVSTTSDVYSLGVLLFKLLTGVVPHEMHNANMAEVVDIATRATVPLASQVIKDTKSAWSKALTGDLDNIVGKALEKNASQRYQSAQELSEDIRRYLTGLPITARVNTWGYRSQKFVRRHLMSVSVAAMGTLTLVALTLFAFVQLDIARTERDSSKRANDFLSDVLLSSGTTFLSSIPGGKNLTVPELINLLPEEIDERFADDPDQQLHLLVSIGWAQMENGFYAQASDTAVRAEQLTLCCVAGPSDTHLSLLNLQFGISVRSDVTKAEKYIAGAMEMLAQFPDAGTLMEIITLTDYSNHLLGLGQLRESAAYIDQAIALNKNPIDNEHKMMLAISLANRSVIAVRLGEVELARNFVRKSIGLYDTNAKFRPQGYALSLYNLAAVDRFLGDYAQGLANNRLAIDELEDVAGLDHPTSYLISTQRTLLQLRLGLEDQARVTWNQVSVPDNVPKLHIQRRSTFLVSGELALLSGDLEQAKTFFEAGINLYQVNAGKPDHWLALLNSGKSLTHHALGESRQALKASEEAFTMISSQMVDKTAIVDMLEARMQCIQQSQSPITCIRDGIAYESQDA